MDNARLDGRTAGLQGTTQSGMGGGAFTAGRMRERTALPALTLLYHPDLERIGERAVLGALAAGSDALVSRLGPDFAPPRKGAAGPGCGRPLGGRFLSRRPLRLRPAPGGALCLEQGSCQTPAVADGVPLAGELVLTPEQLEQGVVLELAQRIVLLLHLFLPSEVPSEERFGLVGESAAIDLLRSEIERVADVDVPVLLCGETGTGKELVACAIHGAGPRREGPFLAVNLGAIAPTLAAAELFGAVKGAFTGATRDREGFFLRAHGGTLFLDEVGEAPTELQAMLLRVLETGEVTPVGARSPRQVDVRVLAATDADLEQRVHSGTFRAPLLHRLAGYEIWLPSLRRRRDDVGRLLVHFLRRQLEEIGEVHRLESPEMGTPPWLPPELVVRLARFDWPGNVRQLKNVAQRLVLGSRGLPQAQLGPRLTQLLQPEDPSVAPPASAVPRAAPRRRPAEIAQEELVEALAAVRWDLQAAADRLCISRPSLYNLIRRCPAVRTAMELTPEEITRCHLECGGDLDAMVEHLEVSERALRRRLKEMALLSP